MLKKIARSSYIEEIHEHGPFDIIGDVHGCYNELIELLSKLGYKMEANEGIVPAGRKLVFVGDLVDRGPDIVKVLKLVMRLVNLGQAFCVMGNHEAKLLKKLNGRNVMLTGGLAETMEQLSLESEQFKNELKSFLEKMPSHYIFNQGLLVVAHGGLKEEMHRKAGNAIWSFALYGDITGKKDENGLPERRDWALQYRGKALVVYGHTPKLEPRWKNNTINIDTGCVFGNKLTALRYPENETISVDAYAAYAESKMMEKNKDDK